MTILGFLFEEFFSARQHQEINNFPGAVVMIQVWKQLCCYNFFISQSNLRDQDQSYSKQACK